MSDLASFVLTVIMVSASGVLAPGPLFFAVVLQGMRAGARAGLQTSVGHMLVELPLVLLLAVGLLSAAQHSTAKLYTGWIGGLALIGFGVFQIIGSLHWKLEDTKLKTVHSNPLLLGITFTGLNPFFIAWWLTVGSKLVVDALILAATAGIVLMYASHIWMDYAWLTFISYLSKSGGNLLRVRAYRYLVIVFGFVMIFFGYSFLAEVTR